MNTLQLIWFLLYYHTLSYTIIHCHTLLYTIIHCCTLLLKQFQKELAVMQSEEDRMRQSRQSVKEFHQRSEKVRKKDMYI